MPILTIHSWGSDGSHRTKELEVTDEQLAKIKDNIKNAKELKRKRMKEIIAQIPPIHWEILKFHNNHTKEETLQEYPEHEEFINRIK